MRRIGSLILAGVFAAAAAGCSKDEPSPTSAVKPREAPSLTSSSAGVTPTPLGTMSSGESMTGLPPGHPPIKGASAPAGDDSEMTLQLQMPAEFVPKPARMMTLQVYAAPKLEGDPEDADVAVSALGAKVALQKNVDRWCSQFEMPAGQTCETVVKQRLLEGTKYPTTLVEIAGTYKGSAMMGPQGKPKPNYEMVAAEIATPDRPYYVKMIGPQKTVEQWKAKLIDAIKAAK